MISKLSQYVDNLQSEGQYFFSLKEIEGFETNEAALRLAIHRLIKKKRIVRLHHLFFAIIPLEYRDIGSPPPSWFIDNLMRFLKRPYYVGILSAAVIHGASHQHPQEFQVVVGHPLRSLKTGLHLVRFFTKHNIEIVPVSTINTETGVMLISPPEVTALDLVRYFKSAGYLNNVATILKEMSEKMEPKALLNAAKKGFELSVIQRLGYLLDQFSPINVTDLLWEWVKDQKISDIPLRPDLPFDKSYKDQKWKVWINEKIETDL